jgi:hypothetical protein
MEDEQITFSSAHLRAGRRLGWVLTLVGVVLFTIAVITAKAFDISTLLTIAGSMALGSGVTGLVILAKETS